MVCGFSGGLEVRVMVTLVWTWCLGFRAAFAACRWFWFPPAPLVLVLSCPPGWWSVRLGALDWLRGSGAPGRFSCRSFASAILVALLCCCRAILLRLRLPPLYCCCLSGGGCVATSDLKFEFCGTSVARGTLLVRLWAPSCPWSAAPAAWFSLRPSEGC